jgi:7-cyano-7-deazaguanine synthase
VRANSCVAVVSGGLDSAVLVHHLAADGWELRLVSFDYGQRHRVELDHAARIATTVGVPHDIVDLRSVGALLSGSALTDDAVDVPDGHYTDESMRSTVVANRNAIFAMVATGVAVADGAHAVALGIHAGDHFIYPDCRPEFVAAAEHLARVANEGFVAESFQVLAPFLSWTKAEIVLRGAELDVPFAETWSCYKGGDLHCGTCGTCVERREAFQVAGVADPTEYQMVTRP